MISANEPAEGAASDAPLPNSRRVYVPGSLNPDLRVPLREIALAPTKSLDGSLENNEPVRVYDTSGPWGDPDCACDVEKGLPALRRDWILKRGDVEEYEGRTVQAQDDGYLSEKHRGLSRAKRQDDTAFRLEGLTAPKRKPLRAKPGKVVTQLAYAKAGIITPEMEFIAIRENMRRANITEMSADIVRNDLDKQHAGSSQLSSLNSQPSEYTPGVFRKFPQRIPKEITPEFVRSEVAAGRRSFRRTSTT